MANPIQPVPIPTLAVPGGPTNLNLSASFDAGIHSSSAWTGHLDRQPDVPSEAASDPTESSKVETTTNDAGENEDPLPRAARALYDFEGKPEFRELVVQAGNTLLIHKEDLAEGWSLAQHGDIMGLLPRKYYIFTSEFTPSPSLQPTLPDSEPPMNFLQPQTTGPYLATLRQSLLGGKSLNRFSSFVTSGAEDYVLNGLSSPDATAGPSSGAAQHHNPFSDDVKASANGASDGFGSGAGNVNDADVHFVETPPAWKQKTPPFRVLVHSPSRQNSALTGAYTLYAVTSLFTSDSNTLSHSRFLTSSSTSTAGVNGSTARSHTPTPQSRPEGLPSVSEEPVQTHVTVYRRFSHFVFLHTALTRRLPGIALPPLPEKQYTGRFNDDFVEARRGDLERWISRVVRHPVVRYSEVLLFFLSCDNEMEWRRNLPAHLAPLPSPGPFFYGHVYHPDFNLDAEDALDAVDRFQRHLKAVGRGVSGLRSVYAKVREAGLEVSAVNRALSYSILSLITSTPIDGSSKAAVPSLAYGQLGTNIPWEEDEDEDESNNIENIDPRRGLMNDEGAWCWREGCEECLRLTKALQKMAETYQTIADLHEDYVRRTQLATHDAMKDVSHPSPVYAPIVDIHRAALSRYNEAASNPDPTPSDHEKGARCETILNTTMAEFDTYHFQKVEDFERIAKENLDDEIAMHEQILARLKAARAAFDAPTSPEDDVLSPRTTSSRFTAMSPLLPSGPRQPSIYERDLTAHQTRTITPLPLPAPHVYDSAATMRPVSVAVREGVGILLGGVGLRAAGAGLGAGSGFRGSVFDFSRFWS